MDSEEKIPLMMVEKAGKYLWQVELRTHHMADWKRKVGQPTIAVVFRVDGKLLGAVYPVQEGALGLQVASDELDFANPVRIVPRLDVRLSPAVVYLKQ